MRSFKNSEEPNVAITAKIEKMREPFVHIYFATSDNQFSPGLISKVHARNFLAAVKGIHGEEEYQRLLDEVNALSEIDLPEVFTPTESELVLASEGIQGLNDLDRQAYLDECVSRGMSEKGIEMVKARFAEFPYDPSAERRNRIARNAAGIKANFPPEQWSEVVNEGLTMGAIDAQYAADLLVALTTSDSDEVVN